MTKSIVTDLLRQVEIFKGIPPDLLNQFADRLQLISFDSGTPIIRKGDDGDSMFVIAAGKVKIHDGEHVVAVTEAGNFFGEFSLLDAAPRSMSVTALDDVKAISISRELFYNLLKSHPEVAKKIISTLTSRLRNQNESIINQLKMREEELTRLVNERTKELKIRNEEITLKNREITDNVNYAKRIQSAILPGINLIQKTLAQSFVLYLPKDIVSGDFYSFFVQGNHVILVAADCTGHGVTGAFLSVIGSSLLHQIIHEKKITEPAKILDSLNEEMILALRQRENESNDGMDVSVCTLDLEKNELQYAGANRPLWFIRNNEVIVYAPDKFPVGGLQILHDHSFTNHSIQLKKEDALYIFSDGYADQFGGAKGKKLMSKTFKEILLSLQYMNLRDQEIYLKDYFQSWKGNNEQVDDVLVIGVKL